MQGLPPECDGRPQERQWDSMLLLLDEAEIDRSSYRYRKLREQGVGEEGMGGGAY